MTTEDRKLAIKKLYRTILNREADTGGLENYLNSNLSIEEIKKIFYSSNEYAKMKILNRVKHYRNSTPTNQKNKFFEELPIYFVNLDRSSDRLDTLLTSFKNNGINNYTRIPAIDVKTLPGDSNVIYNPKVLKFSHKHVGLGHHACVLSFLKAYNEFLKSEHDYAFICEDDLDFSTSSKIDFNFYQTLKYHNPKFYNLKTSAVNQQYMWPNISGYTSLPVGTLLKPTHLTYGWSQIINKAWARNFLERYKAVGVTDYKNFVLDLTPFDSNYNNTIPNHIAPAIDTLSFDEHTYVWIAFGPTEQHASSVIRDFDINFDLASYYYSDILRRANTLSIDSFKNYKNNL
jgi:GR25 family glycosyltransferase involved in LPS biosynthesis